MMKMSAMTPTLLGILLLHFSIINLSSSTSCQNDDYLLQEIDQIMFPPNDYDQYNEEEKSLIRDLSFLLLDPEPNITCNAMYHIEKQTLTLSGCQKIPKLIQNDSFIVDTVIITMSTIDKITTDSFSTYFGIKNLEILSNDKLSEIEDNSFIDCQFLQSLKINNNYKLSKINEKSFNYLKNLKKLELKNNDFTGITQITDYLSNLKHLNSLDIRGNKFTAVQQIDFKNIEKLNITELKFSVKELIKFDKTSLNNLFNLTKLIYYSEYPNQNDIDLLLSINNNLKLNYIEFNNIDLKDKNIITSTLMDNSYNTIKLKNSRLRGINYEWFNTNSWINTIDISNTVFDDFPTALFGGLMFPNLIKLILSHNNFKTIPHDIWLTSTIELLDLSGNDFISIKPNTFHFTPNLKILILSHKTIINIDNYAFKNNDNLIMLDLQNNDFSESSRLFNNLTFYGLNNLQALDLSGCKIKEFKNDNLFENLINLKLLSLKSNQIKYINNKWFKPMKCLTKLDLRSNYFIHFNPSLFRQNFISDVGLYSKLYTVNDELIQFLNLEIIMDKISSDLENCSEIILGDKYEIDKFGGKNDPSNDKCKIIINNYDGKDDYVDIDDDNMIANDTGNFSLPDSIAHPIYVIQSLSFDSWSILRFLYVFIFYFIIFGLLSLVLIKIIQLIRKHRKNKRPPCLILHEDKIDYCGVENKTFSVPYEKMN